MFIVGDPSKALGIISLIQGCQELNLLLTRLTSNGVLIMGLAP